MVPFPLFCISPSFKGVVVFFFFSVIPCVNFADFKEMSYNVVEEPANAGTSREAMLTTSPEGLKRMEDGSSSEEILAPQEMPRRFKVWECGRYGDLDMIRCVVQMWLL